MADSHRELLIAGEVWDAFIDDFHQTLANRDADRELDRP
jgi:hypothetical protein